MTRRAGWSTAPPGRLSIVGKTPVLAGACGTDPFRLVLVFLEDAHVGLTTSGAIGVRTAPTLDESVALVQAIRDAAVAAKREIIVLGHGGPIAAPEDAGYVLSRTTGVAGFFGASRMERRPIEVAITNTMRRFERISAPAATAS